MVDLVALLDSFRSFTSKPISVFSQGYSDRLANAQNFKIRKIQRSKNSDYSDITIFVKPLEYKKPRVKISCVVLKQIFKYLFSIHGLKVTLDCAKSPNGEDLYQVFVSNIRKNTYEEIYIPQDIYMERTSPSISRNIYNRLTESIVSDRARTQLEALFGI